MEMMSRADRSSLKKLCEEAPLTLSETLCAPGKTTPFVYFPVSGSISLVAKIDGNPGLEVGMVGREGMLGADIVLGVVAAPMHAVVQGEGVAWRIAIDVFRRQLAVSPSMKRVLDRYVAVLLKQLTTSVACQRYHEIRPRLARWLLMSQDRAKADTFSMTQEFLAYMLGVRRVSITKAAGDLQRGGLIEYRRGKLQVLDRIGLERAACGCYQVDQESYIDLLG